MDSTKHRRRIARRRIRDAQATASRFLEQRKRELQQDLEQRTRNEAQEHRPKIA